MTCATIFYPPRRGGADFAAWIRNGFAHALGGAGRPPRRSRGGPMARLTGNAPPGPRHRACGGDVSTSPYAIPELPGDGASCRSRDADRVLAVGQKLVQRLFFSWRAFIDEMALARWRDPLGLGWNWRGTNRPPRRAWL